MSLPYFPLYPTDFEADTSHLTLAEDGAYNRLLRLMWMTPGCSLPDDDAWVMRRMRCTTAEEAAIVTSVIAEFFRRKAGRIVNARLAREYQKTDVAHRKRVEAGSMGGKAKALKTKANRSSNALPMPYQPEPEPESIKRDTKVSPKKTAKRLPDDWVLPMEYGSWAVSEGWSESAVRLEADRFKDYWIAKAGRDAVKLDWLATWRNWIRNSKSPKLSTINGGQQNATSDTNRLQRIVTAAAAGSSGKDWG